MNTGVVGTALAILLAAGMVAAQGSGSGGNNNATATPIPPTFFQNTRSAILGTDLYIAIGAGVIGVALIGAIIGVCCSHKRKKNNVIHDDEASDTGNPNSSIAETPLSVASTTVPSKSRFASNPIDPASTPRSYASSPPLTSRSALGDSTGTPPPSKSRFGMPPPQELEIEEL